MANFKEMLKTTQIISETSKNLSSDQKENIIPNNQRLSKLSNHIIEQFNFSKKTEPHDKTVVNQSLCKTNRDPVLSNISLKKEIIIGKPLQQIQQINNYSNDMSIDSDVRDSLRQEKEQFQNQNVFQINKDIEGDQTQITIKMQNLQNQSDLTSRDVLNLTFGQLMENPKLPHKNSSIKKEELMKKIQKQTNNQIVQSNNQIILTNG